MITKAALDRLWNHILFFLVGGFFVFYLAVIIYLAYRGEI